jgi:hypothetical protein
MKKILPLLLLIAAIASAAPPVPLERDLGQGLAYCRVHSLPADLPTAAAKQGPLVLDLRYATSDEGAAAALGAWLKFRSSTATPVFVLLNADTAPAVRDFLAALAPPAGLITLGPASPHLAADIAVNISAAAERTAYEALEHGTPLDALLTDSAIKPRHDEAAIALERTSPPDGSAADPDGPDAADPAPTAAPAAPPPVIDAVLQRAVYLHRSLRALKKL